MNHFTAGLHSKENRKYILLPSIYSVDAINSHMEMCVVVMPQKLSLNTE